MAQIRKETKFLVIHCSATRPDLDIGADEIRGWHLAKGWSDIGYHYVIRRDGTIEGGRPSEEVGAHVEGINHCSVGVCLVGGLNDKGQPAPEYTDKQWDSLAGLITVLSGMYENADIVGHRDVITNGIKKACPCFSVADWLHEGMTPCTSESIQIPKY